MTAFKEKIHFANPVAQYETHRKDILQAIKTVCCNGPYVLGATVEKFENEFAEWNGVSHAVGVGSGTDALTLTLRAFGIGTGDEVITVSFTALATASAIVAAGATPVLVDVDPETFMIDPEKIEAAITVRTKAIIPVHLYGHMCNMDEILSIAYRRGLVVIEDCAQAHGALYKGKKAGTLGDAGCFSFYPTKNLGAIGDAGAAITNNTAIAQKIRELRQYGWNENRVAYTVSNVSRMDPLQAAILSVKLATLNEAAKLRRKIAQAYDRTIDWRKFGRAVILPDSSPAYHLYVVAVADRKSAIRHLAGNNVMSGIHYEFPVHKNPGYVPFISLPSKGLPETDRLSATVLSLPIYPELSIEDSLKIATMLNDFS